MVSEMKRADGRVHPVGGREEQAEVWRHRVVVAEEVLRGRSALRRRVAALGDLRELLGVAEEDEVGRGDAGGDDIGERSLARFVDEEHIDRVAHDRVTPEPAGSGGELGRAVVERGEYIGVGTRMTDALVTAVVVVARLLDRGNIGLRLVGFVEDGRRRLEMTAWLAR